MKAQNFNTIGDVVFDAFQRKRPESAGLASMKARPLASTSNSNNNSSTFASNPTMTGEEIRILRRAREEHSRRGGWVRIFPSASSWDSYRYLIDPATCFVINGVGVMPGRDVRNRFFYFSLVLWKNSDAVRNEFGSVQKTWFGSDIIVMYSSCNSRIVNLQQILQRQQMTWPWCHWRHSQRRQQVNNVIVF